MTLPADDMAGDAKQRVPLHYFKEERLQKMNNRRLGEEKERFVCEWLEEHGYRILERNFRCRTGEIDIVAQEGGYLVFIEVKYRTDAAHGRPQEAVGRRKQRTVSRTALFYLKRYRCVETTPVRFDVVGVSGETVFLCKNAFDYCE